ncbi:hypothetical protein [Kitasatospora sp. NPDC085879]
MNDVDYSYYAGPVAVQGKGHCIYLNAQTDDTAHRHAFFNSVTGFHCG